jgi:hypothetical protein
MMTMTSTPWPCVAFAVVVKPAAVTVVTVVTVVTAVTAVTAEMILLRPTAKRQAAIYPTWVMVGAMTAPTIPKYAGLMAEIVANRPVTLMQLTPAARLASNARTQVHQKTAVATAVITAAAMVNFHNAERASTVAP